MRALLALWRAVRVLAHIGTGLWTIWTRMSNPLPGQREQAVQRWAAGMLEVLDIELQRSGLPPSHGPTLMVSNHISWLDIVVLHACGYCRFVSKAEVRHWPVVGTLARGAGTLFIERQSRRDAMRVVHHMTEQLRAGDVVAIFPEGTTSDGSKLLPFHANLLQAAISAPAAVQPLALRYFDRRSGQVSLAPSYIDDDTLLASVWRTLTAAPLSARVAFGSAELPLGRDRRQWAADLQVSVERLRAMLDALSTP